jgi:hypothetical protein
LDLTAKIVDRRLISENPRGLSAKSGPQVDFTKVQGPLCKISEIIRITNYFPTVNPVHRVHTRWTRAGRPWTHGGADRGHGGALTWSLASGRYGAPKLTGGGAKWRGGRGELGSGLTRARAALWRPSDGGAERGGSGAG